MDDDQALQTLLNVLLTRAGFECDFVSDGEAALQKIDGDQQYAVIVLDLILPGLSGIDLLAQLQVTRPALLQRTIVVTGASTGIVRNVDVRRVYSVIRKPFDISDMIQLATECAYQSERVQVKRLQT
ncbi:MAG TPA: response regulator [Thermoanaerobaculia bacterium]|nr:response regulator [Thermoanaerobaculia bacterium]